MPKKQEQTELFEIAEGARRSPKERETLRAMLAIQDSYTGSTKVFVEYLEESGQGLSFEALEGFRGWLTDKGYSRATINQRIQGAKNRIRAIMGDLTLRQQAQLETALRQVKTLKVNKNENLIPESRILKQSEIRELVTGAGPRDGLIIEFLAVTGCRVSELTGARVKASRKAGEVVTIEVIGKGNKARKVRISSHLFDRIRDTFQGEEYLFETQNGIQYSRHYIGSRIRTLGHRILGKAISPHTFRHSFATERIRKTGKIQAVSEYLGHSSTAITLDMYTHEELTDGELDLG